MADRQKTKVRWLTAALLLVGLTGAHGQPNPAAMDAAALVRELGLPEPGAQQALLLVDRLIGQSLESSRALLALLSQQKPDRPLAAQAAAKAGQVQKEFGLKLRRFELDLADVAGEQRASRLVDRMKAALPRTLLAGVESALAAGPVVSAPRPPGASPARTEALNAELTRQLLSTNSMVIRMMAQLPALSAERSAALQDQLLLIREMLAHQAAMLQLLAGSDVAGGSLPRKNPAGR